jgi:hypothetical protein
MTCRSMIAAASPSMPARPVWRSGFGAGFLPTFDVEGHR